MEQIFLACFKCNTMNISASQRRISRFSAAPSGLNSVLLYVDKLSHPTNSASLIFFFFPPFKANVTVGHSRNVPEWLLVVVFRFPYSSLSQSVWNCAASSLQNLAARFPCQLSPVRLFRCTGMEAAEMCHRWRCRRGEELLRVEGCPKEGMSGMPRCL